MFSRFWRNESGQFSTIAAIALIPMIGFAGAAVDYSRATYVRTNLQSSLDAALLVGVQSADADKVTRATQFFNANSYPVIPGAGSPSVSVAADGTLTGTITVPVKTWLIKAAGIATIDVTVKSIAKPSGTRNSVCILLTEPSQSQPLLLNSNATTQALDCEVHVKSSGTPGAIFNSNVTWTTKRTCIAAASVTRNNASPANVETRCTTIADPFAGTLPTPASSTCTVNSQNYSGTVTLSPGVYCGWFNFQNSPKVTLQPGVYVIKNGGWNVNGGSMSGTDVSIYFADSSIIQYNSNVTLSLAAPESGSTAGILFFEAAGLAKANFVMNSGTTASFKGLVYLPSKNLIMNSNSTMNADFVTVVGNTLILNSNVQWTFKPYATKSMSVYSNNTGAPILTH